VKGLPTFERASRKEAFFDVDVLAKSMGLAASLFVLLYMLRPAFRIQFGIIDDHEIMAIIGRRQRVPITDVPATIIERTQEPLGRFRPAYWTGRVVESAIAGTNPSLWFFDRFILAALTVVAIYLVAVRFVVAPLAACISLLPFLGPQFETWIRLGPNEAYALPLMCAGLSVLILGLHRDRSPAQLWHGYVLLTLSALAKENFLLISGVVIPLSALSYGVRRLRSPDWWVLGVAIAVGVADFIAILIQTDAHGAVYPQPRNAQTLADWLEFAFDSQDQHTYVYAASLACALMLLVAGRRRPPLSRVAGILGIVAVLSLLQAAFYAGAPPVGRYLYPVALVPVVVWCLVGVLSRAAPTKKTAAAASCLAVVVLIFPIASGVRDARASAEASVAATASFNQALGAVALHAAANDAEAIVLQPWEPAVDIERVLSVARFMSAQTDLKVMTLPAPQASDAFSEDLGRTLESWSAEGYDQLDPYVATSQCVSIVFGENKPVCPTAVPPPG
jgi:hypothetical protein